MFNCLRLSTGLVKTVQNASRNVNIYRSFYNNAPRNYGQSLPGLSNNLKKLQSSRLLLRTQILRYCSDVAKKPDASKKLVGYWLLGSSGMVFVAVVLGVVTIYGSVLYCVLIVVKEIIEITIH